MLPIQFYQQIAKTINKDLTKYCDDFRQSVIPLNEQYDINDNISIMITAIVTADVCVSEDERDERGCFMFRGDVDFTGISDVRIAELQMILGEEGVVINISLDDFNDSLLNQAIRGKLKVA